MTKDMKRKINIKKINKKRRRKENNEKITRIKEERKSGGRREY